MAKKKRNSSTKTSKSNQSKKRSFPQKVKDTKSAMKKAYNRGYHDGWRAHGELPKETGVVTAAKAGYRKGLQNHKKADKYAEKAN